MPMKSITAEAYRTLAPPDDMEDAWVILPGNDYKSEVWDCDFELKNGRVTLCGSFGERQVPQSHLIYYTVPKFD